MSSCIGVDMCVFVGYSKLRKEVPQLLPADTAVKRFRALFNLPLATVNECFDDARKAIADRSRYSLTLTTHVQLMSGGGNITFFRRPCWPNCFSRAQHLR